MANLTTPIIFSQATQYTLANCTFDFVAQTVTIQYVLQDQTGKTLVNDTVTDAFTSVGVPVGLRTALISYLKSKGNIN